MLSLNENNNWNIICNKFYRRLKTKTYKVIVCSFIGGKNYSITYFKNENFKFFNVKLTRKNFIFKIFYKKQVVLKGTVFNCGLNSIK